MGAAARARARVLGAGVTVVACRGRPRAEPSLANVTSRAGVPVAAAPSGLRRVGAAGCRRAPVHGTRQAIVTRDRRPLARATRAGVVRRASAPIRTSTRGRREHALPARAGVRSARVRVIADEPGACAGSTRARVALRARVPIGAGGAIRKRAVRASSLAAGVARTGVPVIWARSGRRWIAASTCWNTLVARAGISVVARDGLALTRTRDADVGRRTRAPIAAERSVAHSGKKARSRSRLARVLLTRVRGCGARHNAAWLGRAFVEDVAIPTAVALVRVVRAVRIGLAGAHEGARLAAAVLAGVSGCASVAVAARGRVVHGLTARGGRAGVVGAGIRVIADDRHACAGPVRAGVSARARAPIRARGS